MNVDIKTEKDSVYRYIPIHRLWEMIAEKQIYFMRNSKWDDPNEGYLAKRWCEVSDQSYYEFKKDYFFLCCCTSPGKEFFWRTYTPNQDGVRLKISKTKLLANSLIKYHLIEYKDKEKLRAEIKAISAKAGFNIRYFFTKRKAFSDEAEGRFYIFDAIDNDEDVYPIKITLLDIIENVTLDPRMPKKVFELHRSFLKSHLPENKILRSNLYDPDGTFS